MLHAGDSQYVRAIVVAGSDITSPLHLDVLVSQE